MSTIINIKDKRLLLIIHLENWTYKTLKAIVESRANRHNFSVDNSEHMRNGDFLPTRLQAQQDAVNLVTQVDF